MYTVFKENFKLKYEPVAKLLKYPDLILFVSKSI